VDCKPQHLVQFARLGNIYVEDVWSRPRPRVGLLNIGEEPEKGDELTVEAHRLLKESDLNGFVGNVLLKFYESVTGFMHGLLQTELRDQYPSLDLDSLFKVFDYTEYGGAPLLGVNGISIICHGGSPPRAICNAVRVARQAIETKMLGHIRREVAAGLSDADDVEPLAAGERGWPRGKARSEGV
jgi:glycerol-3-phosphate acyltransferase PlsX